MKKEKPLFRFVTQRSVGRYDRVNDRHGFWDVDFPFTIPLDANPNTGDRLDINDLKTLAKKVAAWSSSLQKILKKRGPKFDRFIDLAYQLFVSAKDNGFSDNLAWKDHVWTSPDLKTYLYSKVSRRKSQPPTIRKHPIQIDPKTKLFLSPTEIKAKIRSAVKKRLLREQRSWPKTIELD